MYLLYVWVHGMPPKSLLEWVRRNLDEYGLVAQNGGSVYTYFVGVRFSDNSMLEVVKHMVSHTLDAAHWFSKQNHAQA